MIGADCSARRVGAQPQRLGAARLVHGPVQPGTRPLRGVELPDEGEHLPARGRVVRLRLHELPADMRQMLSSAFGALSRVSYYAERW